METTVYQSNTSIFYKFMGLLISSIIIIIIIIIKCTWAMHSLYSTSEISGGRGGRSEAEGSYRDNL